MVNEKKKVRQAAGITLCMTGFDLKMIAMAGQPQQLKASFCCLKPDVSCSCCWLAPGVKKPTKDGS